jgi:hypothetical protein
VVGQVHLLFACLCSVSAFRLSSILPCQSLISLCFKTCLLPNCYLLSIIRIIIQAARCNCVNLFSSSCEIDILSLPIPGHLRCTCCPSTHRPAKPYTPPLQTRHFHNLKRLDTSQPWQLSDCHLGSAPLMSIACVNKQQSQCHKHRILCT